MTRSINKVLGGLEKQILAIAEGLADLNHEVYIVSLDSGRVEPFYIDKGHPNIKWLGLGIGDPAQSANLLQKFRRQQSLTRLISELKPDIAVAFMIGALIYSRIPTFLTRVPLILAERNSPDIYTQTSAKRWRYLYFLLMRLAKRVTIQIPEYADKYPRFLRKRLVSIPNSIDSPRVKKLHFNGNPNFVYGGRFSFQKRLDLLIRSFDIYKKDGGKGSLLLFGSGEQEPSLRDLVEQLETPSVTFNKPLPDIRSVLDKADVNCLLSIWEGFPNFLAEGLKAGIPAIGIEGCDGVTHLVKNGENGWLASEPNVSEIASIMRSIDHLSEHDYLAFSKEATKSMELYRSDEILKRWQKLLVSSVKV